MIKIDGVGRTISTLKKRELKGAIAPVVSVEFTAKHALRIHEDLTMVHTNGQAKYLEQPARQMKKQLTAIVKRHAQKDRNIEAGAIEAAQVLLEAAKALVPVDTGELKRSGRIRVGRSGRFASQS